MRVLSVNVGLPRKNHLEGQKDYGEATSYTLETVVIQEKIQSLE